MIKPSFPRQKPYTTRKRATHRNIFWNLIKSIWNQIVSTIFQLVWTQTDSVRLVPNQSGNVKYNLISIWFDKILKRFFCVNGARVSAAITFHYFLLLKFSISTRPECSPTSFLSHSNWKECNCNDSFPFDCDSNGISFGF